MNLSDTELALSIELESTRVQLLKTQMRALQAELALSNVAVNEVTERVRALMAEQEKRAAEKPVPAEQAQ